MFYVLRILRSLVTLALLHNSVKICDHAGVLEESKCPLFLLWVSSKSSTSCLEICCHQLLVCVPQVGTSCCHHGPLPQDGNCCLLFYVSCFTACTPVEDSCERKLLRSNSFSYLYIRVFVLKSVLSEVDTTTQLSLAVSDWHVCHGFPSLRFNASLVNGKEILCFFQSAHPWHSMGSFNLRTLIGWLHMVPKACLVFSICPIFLPYYFCFSFLPLPFLLKKIFFGLIVVLFHFHWFGSYIL